MSVHLFCSRTGLQETFYPNFNWNQNICATKLQSDVVYHCVFLHFNVTNISWGAATYVSASVSLITQKRKKDHTLYYLFECNLSLLQFLLHFKKPTCPSNVEHKHYVAMVTHPGLTSSWFIFWRRNILKLFRIRQNKKILSFFKYYFKYWSSVKLDEYHKSSICR